MTTGESHYVWGKRFRLKVIERPGRAHIEASTAIDFSSTYLRVRLREQAPGPARPLVPNTASRSEVPGVIAKWEPIVGVSVPSWSIRRMKTKWGSCNRETGHIWFNVELAKKHPDSLEYIVVHEMTHLLERGHGERFTKLMDEFMPDWRSRRIMLNDSPLAHENWDY